MNIGTGLGRAIENESPARGDEQALRPEALEFLIRIANYVRCARVAHRVAQRDRSVDERIKCPTKMRMSFTAGPDEGTRQMPLLELNEPAVNLRAKCVTPAV